ncbi:MULTISPECIES: hypothetical protein [Actinotignum]|uniref:hypothetical protein n=1 Tax=Actinotignum TaxID=1653174 RepID=UPI00254FD404|nr:MULTISPECIES: hypothetical protein [Actinotignum]MDK7272078.1 hypothetical protein [Actinotignum schaalii]MDK8287401.1 hypothetical protein [Actinotignum sanguinis]MDK8651429.1 hypothetical protein [Actinotignum sanguinis]MDK8801954.1 hypothetical protein [Actinotignum sanguinis]MDY5144848.1 hypothetical protein [Actinotignum timonense]
MYYLDASSKLTTHDIRYTVRQAVINAGLESLEKQGLSEADYDMDEVVGKLTSDADTVFEAWTARIITAAREHLASEMLSRLSRKGEDYDRGAGAAHKAYEEARDEAGEAYKHDEYSAAWDAYAEYMYLQGMDLACEKHQTYIREILAKVPSLADLTIPDDQPSNAATVEEGE